MCNGSWFKIHYLPGLTSAWFIFTYILCYIISVLNGHVYPLFPFISDTGTKPPESCIFGQMLNIGCVIMAIAMYVRYIQIDLAIKSGFIKIERKWNNWAMVAGSFACFGISLVGNFQETNVVSVHMLGAVFIFVIGSSYFVIQTRIAYEYMHLQEKFPQYAISKQMFYFRFILVCGLIGLTVLELVFVQISMNSFTGKSMEWFTEEDGDFQSRLIAAFTEWILAFTLFIYIASFTNEFKTIEFHYIKMELKNFQAEQAEHHQNGQIV